VSTEDEHLRSWEKAFLGEKPLLATSVSWQCTVGVFFALSQIYLSAMGLHARRPELYSRWWIAFPFLVIAVLCLSWNFLAKASKIKALLRQNTGQPAYDDNLLSAQSLSLTFFMIMVGLGVAMIIVQMIFTWS